MITYVCAYWLSPDASNARVAELKRYFDLQCYLKKRMGRTQIIMTNIDYPGAIDIQLPADFKKEDAMFTRYYGVQQLIKNGLQFPICLHDHDFFNSQDLPYSESAIFSGAVVDGCFSEQAVVYPKMAKQALVDFASSLASLGLALGAGIKSGYGTEVRHEGLNSTEHVLRQYSLDQFKSLPMLDQLKVKDQVSFDILKHHSLDVVDVPIKNNSAYVPAGSHAVHGHINKGEASEAMLDWLAENLS